MAVEFYTFDPDGDLLLILSRPPDDAESEDGAGEEDTNNTPAGSPTDERIGEDAAESADTHPDTGASANSAGSPSLEVDPTPDEDEPDREPAIVVHMLVSSKHMMLASPVFKAMLQHSRFKEGQKLSATGKAEIPLPDDDPYAFTIILDIIHGRNRQVPREIDLDLLSSISKLVDKYQMVEAVESFSNGWIDAVEDLLPAGYATTEDVEDVHRWLGISWVFAREDEFVRMTELMERGCWEGLAEDIEEVLPIPGLIVETILMKRQEALSDLYAFIEQTARRYQQSEICCPRTDSAEWALNCDSLLLGSLLKSASSYEILPVPESPYGDISFDELAAKLYSLNVSAICDKIRPSFQAGVEPKPAHGLHEAIEERIALLEERLSGLNIFEFKGEEKGPRPIVGV
ncbi:uncharacterized protein K444DRAFT_632349 [Hyaloscypha bicolor E]|uniref:Uncharacterized protein n=1 Tax=Hyaloscypha bicolor E TaxID=1095630 RepID=A0A2J6T2H2_9HELO|nr:uncharacterized protein K444DRAFT_632349 [Hyaloscypha bicolor E]PMD57216.1 hypothetical protein K444DRAFT_632349 [Hyaloscypha bicolor E]